jgi:hypothetical protein
MCAECWGVKDPARAKRWQRGSRTRPLFDHGVISAENVLWAVGIAIGLVLVTVWGLTEWI